MDIDLFGQPIPIENDMASSWDLVISDMRARDRFGRKKYGTPLQPLNGRHSLKDLYEELLDAVVYARNRLEEDKLKKHAASRFVGELVSAHEDKECAEFRESVRIRDLLFQNGL